MKSNTLVSDQNSGEKPYLNSTALRMAKTPSSFGRCECNRVKAELHKSDLDILGKFAGEKNPSNSRLTLLHSDSPKFYAILAFLSAIGLVYKVIHTHASSGCALQAKLL